MVGTSSDGPYVVTYDSNDQFNVGTRAESPESFAENLQDGDTVDIEVQGHDRDDIDSFTRYWFPWFVTRGPCADRWSPWIRGCPPFERAADITRLYRVTAYYVLITEGE